MTYEFITKKKNDNKVFIRAIFKMIELLINQIVEKIPPSSGSNLIGFKADLDNALWKSKHIIHPYRIFTSSDPRQLITVEAQIVNRVKSLRVVFEAVEKIWGLVIYRHFEASSYEYYKEAAVLRFVTIISNEKLFVSGAIVLEGEKYQSLISEHQQKYNKTVDSLPSMTLFEK